MPCSAKFRWVYSIKTGSTWQRESAFQQVKPRIFTDHNVFIWSVPRWSYVPKAESCKDRLACLQGLLDDAPHDGVMPTSSNVDFVHQLKVIVLVEPIYSHLCADTAWDCLLESRLDAATLVQLPSSFPRHHLIN